MMARSLLLMLLLLVSLSALVARAAEPCKPERLSTYRVTVQTYWSREKFPKHYPDWRPNAQFSKVVGRTHNQNYVLWRLGTIASDGLKDLAENSKSELLDSETQGRGGVFDEFLVPAIQKGVGRSEATFFADGNHSKVSLVSRIVPSPDWFIGIDSFDLCVLGKWVDVVTLELDPNDAGTDNGFTFTAPNWASEPREKIYRITSQMPNHPANSFHYPHLKKLPPLATVTFVKAREYELSQTFFNDGREEVPRFSFVRDEEVSNTVEPLFRPFTDKTTVATSSYYPRRSRIEPEEPGLKPGDDPLRKAPNDDLTNNIRNPYVNKKIGNPKNVRGRRVPRNCRVSVWSDWSSCSRTCGIGEKRRTRSVLKHARRGGRPCPSLLETSWCGSARCANSSRSYFDW